MYPRLRIFAFGKFSNPVSNSTDRMNPGLAFDRHRLVMPGQVRAGIPRTGSGVPIAAEKKTTIFIGSVVGLQERLDPLPQLGIAHAFAIQDCGAFREVMVVYSLQENSLRARRVKRHGMLLRPSTTSRFRSSMRHLRLGLSKKSKEGQTVPSCWSGRAGKNPEGGAEGGAGRTVLKERTARRGRPPRGTRHSCRNLRSCWSGRPRGRLGTRRSRRRATAAERMPAVEPLGGREVDRPAPLVKPLAGEQLGPKAQCVRVGVPRSH